MKNLLKIQAFALLLFVSSQLSAQTYMIKGGLNLSEFRISDRIESYGNLKLNPGFHIGGSVIFPIHKAFSLDLGLQFTTKGVREEFNDEFEGIFTSGKLSATLYYIEVPVKFRLTHNFDQIAVYGAFGPYVGLGLAGRMKSEFTFMGETTSNINKIDFGKDDLNRLDGGLVFEAGIEYQRFLVGLSYTMGLIDVSNEITNQVYSFSIGYKLGS
tara:strand:+ start:2828 stop:3466 length:639 start_codon:yes stop_codon:yes gene_type:complete